VVACCLSAVSMPARIAWGISLRFDNAAADPVSPYLADDRLPDKISGQFTSIDWQTGPCEPPDIVHNVPPGIQLTIQSLPVGTT
jgi:hypothetical protein